MIDFNSDTPHETLEGILYRVATQAMGEEYGNLRRIGI
jgi:hypothetical protein